MSEISKQLEPIFYPESVAVVGASNQFGKWGSIVVTNIVVGGFKGRIYPVNSTDDRVVGLPAYKSLVDIPEPVDLVIIATPAHTVPEIFQDIAASKSRGAVIISSGFSETDEDGTKLEEGIVSFAREHGFRFIGPNTMGITSSFQGLYATGLHARPNPGGVALVAQSGNLGTQLLAWAEEQNIELGIFIGSGNEADLECVDYLAFLGEDKNTKTILMYVEGIDKGRDFMETAARITPAKPVIMLKGGRTDAGGDAARSHTGSLAGSARMYKAMCRQTGVVWAETSSELLDLSAAFTYLPLPKGNRVGISTLGGGWGVVTTDACIENGLEVPPLPEEIIERINPHLPSFWSRNNPVDLVGSQNVKAFLAALEELVKWDGVDAVLTLGVLGRITMIESMMESFKKTSPELPEAFWDAALQQLKDEDALYRQRILELMKEYEKPIIGVSLMDDGIGTVYGPVDNRYKGVTFPTPEQAVNAMAKMLEYHRFLTL